ncbi:MAG: hypothetical protein M1814_006313 [Vezdaea aestivalis]|nr:MAG: hypothetical protein M1814_006313 [Vezdaea aestivalis]
MSFAAIKDLGGATHSFIYYVASCSTIRKCAYRRKREKEAARAKIEKQQLEIEQPGLYRHPLPFATNPNWEEDIRLGPSSTRKGARSVEKKEGKSGFTSGKARAQESSLDMEARLADNSVEEISTPFSTADDQNWNRRRYQRLDEDLWGHTSLIEQDGDSERPRPVTRGSAVGMVGTSNLSVTPQIIAKPSRKRIGCEPDELARPVITRAPRQGDHLQWMRQPPPPAKVMEGKEPANRSRATSGASSGKKSSSGKSSAARSAVSQRPPNSTTTPPKPPVSQASASAPVSLPTEPEAKDFAIRSASRPQKPPIPIPNDTDEDEPPSPFSSPMIPPFPEKPQPVLLSTSRPTQIPLGELLPPSSTQLNSRTSSPTDAKENSKEESANTGLESLFSYNIKFPDRGAPTKAEKVALEDRRSEMRAGGGRWSMDV